MTFMKKILLTTGITVATATPAFAGGPLIADPAVLGCAVGQPIVWGNGGANIPFNPDQGDLNTLSNAQATTLVQASFDVWGAVPTSTASYTNAGQLPVDVDISNFVPWFNGIPDGLSPIVYDDTGEIFDLVFGPGSGILGFAGPEFANPANCTITEGQSFLNGPAFTNATAAFDVMVHEFGHYSNLAHTDVNGQIYLGSVGGDTNGPTPSNPFVTPPPFGTETVATMYPFYYGPGIGTQTLHKDDIASLSTLYPDPSFGTSTGSISGTIFNTNGATKLTGVNVIARNVADPFIDASAAISSDFTDDFSQANPVTGTYTIEGLTPGATYAVYVNEILAGGFSTPPLSPLPGPEEFHNGGDEASTFDDPSVFAGVPVSAGSDASGTDIIFNAPMAGEPLLVGDDGFVELPLPFDMPICGVNYDSVFVNANGHLTFGEPAPELLGGFLESRDALLSGPPRIAGVWDDLNPTAGGAVFFTEPSFGQYRVHWDSVPEFPAAGSNTFSINMAKQGFVFADYGDLTVQDGLAGITCGRDFTTGFEFAQDLFPSFFPSYFIPSYNLFFRAAVFEQFIDGVNPNDLEDRSIFYDARRFSRRRVASRRGGR